VPGRSEEPTSGGPATTGIPRVLSIAGSDSGGGAGIQADLKAFAACGVHGMTAVTAITAQNTVGVTGIHNIPPEMILAQVRAVVSDIGVDAVKIGMLATVATIEVVARALDELPPGTPVVLDPVMVAESGAELLRSDARRALVELMLPRATVATPNIPEAVALARGADPGAPGGDPCAADPDPHALARAVYALGPGAVVITGGHRRDRAIDVFFDGVSVTEIPGESFESAAAHGSGCTHSSVLAAGLAAGLAPLEAARRAKRLAAAAVRDGLDEIGAGAGPVDVLGLRRRTGLASGSDRL
jgi:hydroxymethylpyrimidine/phosphomethylpyrimidine kinase